MCLWELLCAFGNSGVNKADPGRPRLPDNGVDDAAQKLQGSLMGEVVVDDASWDPISDSHQCSCMLGFV